MGVSCFLSNTSCPCRFWLAEFNSRGGLLCAALAFYVAEFYCLWLKCFPFQIGGEYRLQAASRNLVNHVDDFPNSLSFDEGTEEVSKRKPSSHFYTSFSKPSVTQPQNLAVTGQSPPNKLGAPKEKAVAGESMKWESKHNEPISFPSRQDNKVSLVPAAIQYQLTPLDAFTNRKPVSHDFAGTSDPRKKVPSKVFTSLSMVPPHSQSWPAESQTRGKVGVSTPSFPKVGLGSSSSRGGSNKTPMLQEGAFHYDSGNAGVSPDRNLKQERPLLYPSAHAKLQDDDSVGAKDYGQSDNFAMWALPSYWKPSTVSVPLWKPSFQSTLAKDRMMGSPFSGAGRLSRWPQNLVTSNQKIKVLERVSQPALQSLPKKRIVHTKNGHRRARVLLTKTAYTPEYEASQMMDAMERPAQDSWGKH